MVVMYQDEQGKDLVQVSTTMRAEDWRYVQIAFLDVTSDLMDGKLSNNGKVALSKLMQLLKDMMLSEDQTARGLQETIELPDSWKGK